MRRGYRSNFDRSRGRGNTGERGRGGQYHQPSFQDPSGMRYGETQRSQSENQRRNPYDWDRAYPNSSTCTSYSGWNVESAGQKESDQEREQSSDGVMHRVGFDGSATETESEIQREQSGGTLRDWYFNMESREMSGESAAGDWESIGKPGSNVGRDSVGESARRSWEFGEASGRTERHAESGEASGEDVGGWGVDVTARAGDGWGVDVTARAGEQLGGGVLGKRKEPPGEQDLGVEHGSAGSGEKQMRLHADFESVGHTEKSQERRECSETEPGEEATKGSSETPVQEEGEGSQRGGGSEDEGKAKREQQKKKPKDPPPPEVSPEEIAKINRKVLTVEGHISSEQFFCTLCLAKLNSKKNLQKHIVAFEHIRRISTVCGSSKSPFFCQICFCNCTSKETLAAHLQGKKHIRNLQIVEQSKVSQHNHHPLGNRLDSMLREDVVKEGDGLSLGMTPCMMKFFSIPGPFIGLQYAMEVGADGDPCPKYVCTLCNVTMDAPNSNLHFASAAHRMNVLKKDHPSQYSELCALRLKKGELGEKLREVAREIEAREGRKIELIKRRILASPHQNKPMAVRGRGGHQTRGKWRAESQAGSWRDQQQSQYQSQFGSPDQQSTRGQRGGFVRGRGRGRGFRETRGGRGTGKSFPGYNQGMNPSQTQIGTRGSHRGTHRGSQLHSHAPFHSGTGTANQSSFNSQSFQSPNPPAARGGFNSPPAVRPPQWNHGGFAPTGGIQYQQQQPQAPTHPILIPRPLPPPTPPALPPGHPPGPLLPPAAPHPHQPPFQQTPPAMGRAFGPVGVASQQQQGFQDQIQEQIQQQVQEQIRKQVQEQVEKQFHQQQQQQHQQQQQQRTQPHTSAPPLQSLVRNITEMGPDASADVAQIATEMVQSEEQAEMALQLSSALTQALLAYRIKSVSSSITDNPLSAVINALQSGGGIQLPGNQPGNQQAQLPGNQSQLPSDRPPTM